VIAWENKEGKKNRETEAVVQLIQRSFLFEFFLNFCHNSGYDTIGG